MQHDWIADGIAALALIVAALPTIRGILRPARLKLTLQQYCTLQHYCGHPQVFVFIDIHNIGGRPTTISRIDFTLQIDGTQWSLGGRTYVAEDFVARLGQLLGEQREMLVGHITLSPNEHWRGLVDAYNYPSSSDEKVLHELAAEMEEETERKRAALSDSSQLVTLDAGVTERAERYFSHRFGLKPGNYKITVIVDFDDGKKQAKRTYSFTLWDRPAKELRDIADNYKYGLQYAHSKGVHYSVRLEEVLENNRGR